MKMHSRRVSFVAALTVAALTATFIPASATAQDAAPPPAYYVVTADIDVRSGPADSYYPFGRIERGSVIKVIGEKNDWARVVTAGPAFDRFFAFLRYPRTEAGRFKLEASGQRGRTQGVLRVLAPNMNTRYDPNDSWKRILLLEGDREVKVFETHDDGNLIVHKIALPPDAEGWVNMRFLESATNAQITAWKTAAAQRPQAPKTAAGQNAGPEAAPGTVLARDEPVVRSVTPPAAAATIDETTITQETLTERTIDETTIDVTTIAETTIAEPGLPDATIAETTIDEIRITETTIDETRITETTIDDATATIDETTSTPAIEPEKGVTMGAQTPPRSPKERLEDLEAAYARLREEPIATAEVVPMRTLYLELADASVDDDAVFRYAQARAEQLAIWADLQKRRAELSVLRQRLDLTAEESRAMRLALEANGVYAAVGRLAASTIYDGSRLPRLLRIQEVSSGRTIAYVQPDETFDYYPMIGQLIGVVGRKYKSPELGVHLVEPKRIDLLAGQTG